jgi:hypothetical protein
VQWNNEKKCVLKTMSDLLRKVDRKARKPWIRREMINETAEQMKRKNVNNEEGRKHYRRLRNELKETTDKAMKEYLESICDEITEFQRVKLNYLICMKTKEIEWKENHGIQYIGINDSEENIIADKETNTDNLGEFYEILRST